MFWKQKIVTDIDIDCVESDRPAIFKHIIERFGDDKTARVASFGTLADRSVIEEIGRGLRSKWELSNFGAIPKSSTDCHDSNPYRVKTIDGIKKEYDADAEKTRSKYQDIFYYYDGLVGTKISQSVHPAGMVISPITLNDNYGVFVKDNENCLMMDMEEAHEVGASKYDLDYRSRIR